MIEKAFKGNKAYFCWIGLLLAIISLGIHSYYHQIIYGLGTTGMGRDISWGIYVAQFTFLVGVAASAVMVVLPYYLHDYKEFGKIVVIGEFLAVSAATICLLFIIADMGHPIRVFYVLLHPHPKSIVFWDVQVLNGYLLLNLISGWTVLEAERKGVNPPKWLKPLIYISIFWAFSIHTVTAFLYAGTPGRHLWLTAVLAPRFLASAFAVGPAFLILISFILRKFADFDVGDKAIKKLATIATYASIANFFFIGMEFFTAFYSNIPGHMHSLEYLYFGLEGKYQMVPWMWFSIFAGISSIAMFLFQHLKPSKNVLIIACIGIIISLWIDKGIGLIIGGFMPSPEGEIVEYNTTFIEITVTLGIWAIGLLILTTLLKIVISVKKSY
tara:strand:+ start:977 stop:2128 length:1152 start_codon:yes stop_codon:yes gene_type:complete